jgi:hypothetical protein
MESARGSSGIRVSDAERDRAIAVLRDACVEGRLTLDEFSARVRAAIAARTRAELAELTHDLPAVPVTRSARETSWILAILGSARRDGRWRIARQTGVVALMGGCSLDLRQAFIEGSEVTITVLALMGSVRIIVPREIPVEVEGLAILGSKKSRLGDHEPRGDGPVVRIRGLALMGSLEVVAR